MARLLIITVGIRSHLNSCIALSLRAMKLGYECVLASAEHSVREDADACGLQFHHLVPPEGDLRPQAVPGTMRRLRSARTRARARGRAVLSGMGLLEVLAETDPALVLADSELHEVLLTSLLEKWPTAALDTHLSIKEIPGVPVQADSMVPTESTLSRLRCALGWRSMRMRRRAGRLVRRLALAPWDKDSVMRRLAADYGADFDSLSETQHWPLYMFPDVPVVRGTVPELDFVVPAADGQQLFVGPLILGGGTCKEDPEIVRQVESFLADQPRHRPMILMSLGTMKTLPRRIRLAVEAARSWEVTMVIATGQANPFLPRDDLPDNVFTMPWLPLANLLPRASAMICHGGSATVHECIRAGVPMLVYSTGFLDQDGNAARVAGMGLGLVGRRGDDAGQMRRQLEALVADSSFIDRGAATRRAFDAYGSDAQLDAVLGYCRGQPAGAKILRPRAAAG